MYSILQGGKKKQIEKQSNGSDGRRILSSQFPLQCLPSIGGTWPSALRFLNSRDIRYKGRCLETIKTVNGERRRFLEITLTPYPSEQSRALPPEPFKFDVSSLFIPSLPRDKAKSRKHLPQPRGTCSNNVFPCWNASEPLTYAIRRVIFARTCDVMFSIRGGILVCTGLFLNYVGWRWWKRFRRIYVQYCAFLYFYRRQVNAIFVQPTSLAM